MSSRMTASSPLISPEELRAQVGDPRLVLVDVRTGPDARARYQSGHLPGALFVDMDADLAAPPHPSGRGGRHPLPSTTAFAELLGRLGIAPDTRVVAYDEKQGANAASRFWWMLRAAGHDGVRVLDGGLQCAIAAGIVTVSAIETARPVAARPFSEWRLPIASIDDVRSATMQTPSHTSAPVIDVREPKRYRGEQEPIDKIAGHIPGAINLPFADNLSTDGRFLPPNELRAKYATALGDTPAERAIVHCGSGVTACHTLLAFEIAGLATPRLYVGSWSDWSNQGNPVATGAQP